MIFDSILQEYLKDIDEAPLLTVEQEQELAGRIIEHNDPEARELLIRSNLRLVVNIAKRYVRRGMVLSDIVEEGNLGLLRAIDCYDLDHGVRFSTYAAWWIKQSIKRALQTSTQPLHIPSYMVELIHQWRQTSMELETKLGQAPDIEQVAKELQLPLKKAKIVSEIADTVNGGFQSDSLEENQGLDETLEDHHGDDQNEFDVDEMQKAISLLSMLDPRESQVLTMRFGLDGSEPITLKEIGQKLDLTRERVRQIQHSALSKLNELMCV